MLSYESHPALVRWCFQSPSLIAKLLQIVSYCLQILLWPFLQTIQFLFPHRDTDGLAPAVSAKAAQQFVSYLKSLPGTSDAYVLGARIVSSWSPPIGFAALKQEAVSKKSLIVLYLHAPLHREARTFAQQFLNHRTFMDFIAADGILATGFSIHTAQGAQLANMLDVTSFPVLCVLQPTGSNTLQLVFKAQGQQLVQMAKSNALMNYLNSVQQRHLAVLTEAEVRRLQRQAESDLRRQQDEEYQATLQADREREQQKAMQRAAEEVAQLELQKLRDQIRPEPDASDTKNSTMIRFCLPTGAKINRRFENTETVSALKGFLRIYCVDNNIEMGSIGLSTNFPRKTFEDSDNDKTLTEAELSPQAVLMVQDLDA